MSDIKSVFCATALSVAIAIPVLASASSAQTPLRDNDAVNNRLVVAGIVRRIHKRCPSITYRKMRSYFFLRSIYDLAQDQGYSENEIEAYIDDEDEEARLYTFVDSWLSNRGAVTGNAESYCAIGRAEMTAESQIGNYLRTD